MSLFEVMAHQPDRKTDFLYRSVRYLLGYRPSPKRQRASLRYKSVGTLLRRRYTHQERCCALTKQYTPCKNKHLFHKRFCYRHQQNTCLQYQWK